MLKRLGSKLLQPEKFLVENLVFGAFFRYERGLIALKINTIYFSDLGRKFESGFGLCDNGFLNGFLTDVFAMAILLGLGTDKRSQAVAE